MANITESPKLKRKREEKEPLRKKIRTHRKSKAGPGENEDDTQMEVGVATPVSNSKIEGGEEATSSKFQTHVGLEDSAPSASSRKDKKKSKAKKSEEEDTVVIPALTPTISVKVEEKPKISTGGSGDGQRPSERRNKEKRHKVDESVQNLENDQEADDEVPPPKESTVKSGTEQTPSKQRKKTKHSNKDKEGMQDEASEADAVPKKPVQNIETSTMLQKTTPKSNKNLRQSRKGWEHATKKEGKPSAPWSVSAPMGGWFLPRDPVFSPDEKYLILANTRALQIYSTETSLLASVLPAKGVLSAYALSSTKSNHVYIAESSGLITLWDWIDGTKIGRWDIGTSIRQVTVVTPPESTQDLLYCHEVGSSHIINIHALRAGNQPLQTELKRILKTSSPINNIQVLLGGKIVVVGCANSIMVGKRLKLHKAALKDFEYAWREFKTSKRITSFSAYVRIPERPEKAKIAGQDSRDNIDLAVGDEEGAIFLFEDMLSSFARIEMSQKKSKDTDIDDLKPKRLHWHREAVGSVKWSLDGNYLISGGAETVLVIWQLSTGQQQHLPHLTATIENIVLSPSGASYALLLANNSVVVLSTSELEAKTNIIGIQSRRVDLEQMPRESSSNNYSFDIFNQVSMVVDPKNKQQIIFSMPSSQPRHRFPRAQPEPYVQTYDFAIQRPISRQALTRNNATDLNMGPDGRRILEPNIKFLQISNDGKWLATVDEWVPPPADMGYLDEGIPEFNEEERTFRREIYLKFWQWDEKSSQWKLDSRIDAPHFFEDVGAIARVFDLVPDPTGLGFATVGEDRVVRIWRPKTRVRDGITVRGADKSNGEGLVTWSLDRSVELSNKLDVLDTNPNPTDSLPIRTSRLSFSADGSALAAGVSWTSNSDPGVIHVVDAKAGVIRRSITELNVIALSCLGLVGRYLVVVSDSISVWDMVLDQLVYCIPFDPIGINCFDRAPLVRLAINENDGTFAVSNPQFEKNGHSKSRGTRYFKKATSKVSIFEPLLPKALWSSTIPDVILSLAAARDGKGYIVLDSSSSVRHISPTASALQLITPPPEPAPHTDGTQQDGNDREENGTKKIEETLEVFAESEDLLQNSENDKPVVRPQQLQGIFDIGPSHALPPVKDLFDAVVELYARKPRASNVVNT